MAPAVVLGVTGSVAAYRAADLARRLMDAGCCVTPVLTRAATRFVTPLQLGSLTGTRAYTDLWDEPMAHISLASADAIVVAPATANTIGKAANGIGDDLLSTLLLAARGSRVFAPAMNWRMYRNPAVQRNIRLLEEAGVHIVPPEQGLLACGEEGEGRLASAESIVLATRRSISSRPLSGQKVVVTSGPTREPLDPVRFVSNRSSGRMGHALAEEAAVEGGDVCLITGPVGIPAPPGVRVRSVETAHDMAATVREESRDADVLIMAAAVGDFRPEPVGQKIPRSADLNVVFHPTEDVLASLDNSGAPRIRVGFAAETGALVEKAEKKCHAKNLDFIVLNDVTEPGAGFDVETNAVTIIHRNGRRRRVGTRPKREIAGIVVQEVVDLLGE